VELTTWEKRSFKVRLSIKLNLIRNYFVQVSGDHVDDFVKVVRRSMEMALTLSVKLPVKVRTGSSWGTLQEVPSS